METELPVTTPRDDDTIAADWYSATMKQMTPNTVVDDHSHPWDVRAIVTAGEISLTVDGVEYTYGVGEVFTMAAGCPHQERVGPIGVEYLVHRSDPV